ncbi:MAG: hypothetical protein ABIG93_03745 [archaeon]|nr:hypothetical protein [Nanoarchaeota archaeon]
MKIKKIKFTIVICAILMLSLLLSSCSSEDTGAAFEGTYKQGYTGLVIEKVKNYPPDEVYQAEDIEFQIELKNEGAYDLSNGHLQILGFDSKYVDIYDWEGKSFPTKGGVMEGRSVTNPVGDKENLNFEASVWDIKVGAERQDFPYLITATYDYSNELAVDVCIDPSEPDYEVYGGCTVGSRDYPNPMRLGGQGGPLAVTEIEEISTGTKVEFRILIENMGSSRSQAEEVTLIKSNLGQDTIDCEFRKTGDKSFEFEDEQYAELVCTKYHDITSSYPTTLFLEYFYTYKVSKDYTLRVRS